MMCLCGDGRLARPAERSSAIVLQTLAGFLRVLGALCDL